MSILIFLIVGYILLSIGLYFIFQKAGVEPWKGFVPVLNFIEWCKLVGRPTWHVVWLFVPLVNIFVYAAMAVELVRSFGKYKFVHSFLAVVAAPIYFILLGNNKEDKYLGQSRIMEREYMARMEEAAEKNEARALKKLEANNPYKKTAIREWVEAIAFAVFAAAFIRMFLIEAYVIPTSSMEGSMLVGDFLFVSKAHYGIRTPKTVAMVPLLHNRLPFFNTESYLKNPSLEFKRLPALETIDRNDPVVFNYPEGDSVYVFPQRTWSVYDYRRNSIRDQIPQHHQRIKQGKSDLITRPIDKKDHYIKRCVAIPGDSLEIRDRQVYINGAAAENPPELQYVYLVKYPPGTPINTRKFDEWGISREDQQGSRDGMMILVLNEEQKAKVQAMDSKIEIEPAKVGETVDSPEKIFPHDPANFKWNRDNFGPIYIPKKGATVTLTPQNIALYRRIIDVYEDNDFRESGGKFIINGEESNQYTFKMNYYWMMGDNRHNSEDARMWGFVPENHVVGKPLIIWMSAKDGNPFKGIRFNRIFKRADKL